MKAASLAVALAAVARAVDVAPRPAETGAKVAPEAGAGYQAPIPDSVRKLGRTLTRFGGCFVQRTWNDAKNVDCGQTVRPGGDTYTNNLVECVCRNREQVAHQVRANFDVCVDSKAPYSSVLRAAGKDVGSFSISALCGAYKGGHYRHIHRVGHPGPDPGPGAPSRPEPRPEHHPHRPEPRPESPDPGRVHLNPY